MVASDDPRREDEPEEVLNTDPLDEARLELGDDDGRLPWLEGDDDDAPAPAGIGQLLPMLLISLLVLGVIVAGIWWASHRTGDDTVVADGSTIKAPAEPYKEPPSDPGGKTFDGTGDTSFAVSEGRDRPATIDPGAAARPGFETLPAATPSASAAASPASKKGAASQTTATAVDSTGVGVQVGAYSTRAAADAGWSALAARHDALSGLRHRVVEGKADIGTVYRLQAIAADAGAARALCGRLQSAGLACQVKN